MRVTAASEGGQLVAIADGVALDDARAITDDLRIDGISAEFAASTNPTHNGAYQILVPNGTAERAYGLVFGTDGDSDENWYDAQPVWLRAVLIVGGVLVTVVILFFLMLAAL